MRIRIAPMSPTIVRLLRAAEADLRRAEEWVQATYEAESTLARARNDARPHPDFAAWGPDWTRPWEPGEYEATLDARMAAFDAASAAERRHLEEEAGAANAAHTRAVALWRALAAT